MTKEITIKVNVPSGKVLTDVVEKTVDGETVFVPVFENKALFKPGDFIYNPEKKSGGIFAAVRKNVLYVFVYDKDLDTTVEDSVGKPSQWEHCTEDACVSYKRILAKEGLVWNQEKLCYEKTKTEESGTEYPYKKGESYVALTPFGIKDRVWEGSSEDILLTMIPTLHAKTREELGKKIAKHVSDNA